MGTHCRCRNTRSAAVRSAGVSPAGPGASRPRSCKTRYIRLVTSAARRRRASRRDASAPAAVNRKTKVRPSGFSGSTFPLFSSHSMLPRRTILLSRKENLFRGMAIALFDNDSSFQPEHHLLAPNGPAIRRVAGSRRVRLPEVWPRQSEGSTAGRRGRRTGQRRCATIGPAPSPHHPRRPAPRRS